MPDQRLYSILAFAGAAPFVAAAVLPLLGFVDIGPFGPAHEVAAAYGLAIVCFLAGTHWGTYLTRARTLPVNLFITSNVVVLGAWFPFMLASTTGVIVALLIAFAYLLFVDYRLLAVQEIDSAYFRVRVAATSLAAVSLVVVLFSL